MQRREFLAWTTVSALVNWLQPQQLWARMQTRRAVSSQALAAREAIHKHIDSNLAAHIAKIQEYLRQPSISAQNVGIRECAELTRQYLAALGCRETALVPTAGHPGVWGYYDAGVPKTLVIYWMYDVQPVEEHQWASPPFEARVAEDKRWGPSGRIIRARGAINTKGPERAFLNALESIKAVQGELPLNLMFVCEGEEEMSSKHLPDIIARYQSRLRTAHAVLFPFCSQGRDGRASLNLGNKGIVYVELESRGGPHGGPKQFEIHSSLKAAVDSPVWRLVQALATLTDPSGNRIRIEGVTAPVRPPSESELQMLEALLPEFDEKAWKEQNQIDRWIGGASPREALYKYLFDPTLNIDGMWAGYTGEGGKTILPHKANAKLDFRLVPNQRAEDIAPLLRQHLDRHGFTDIQINWSRGYDWSQTSADSAAVQTALSVYKDYNVPVSVWPRIAGSAPFYLFTRDLQLPLVMFGLGHGGGAHSVDEYLVIDAAPPLHGLAGIEKGFADFVLRFAAS